MILTLKMSLRNLVPLGIDNHPQIIPQSLKKNLLKIILIFNIQLLAKKQEFQGQYWPPISSVVFMFFM